DVWRPLRRGRDRSAPDLLRLHDVRGHTDPGLAVQHRRRHGRRCRDRGSIIRRRIAPLVSLFVMTGAIAAQEVRLKPDATSTRPVPTFSIVARDPATGELRGAVQSHWFSVGSVVPWAEAGVGAIATQSFVDPSYGKNGLDLMRSGKSAPDALKELLAKDEAREVRQVGMIDS